MSWLGRWIDRLLCVHWYRFDYEKPRSHSGWARYKCARCGKRELLFLDDDRIRE